MATSWFLHHVTTCLTIDNLHLLPTKKSNPRGPMFGEPLYQWLGHISLLNLVVLRSVKEKLILTVLNLLIQAICQKPSLHMVPYHLIFTGGCFSKHYLPPKLICGSLCYWVLFLNIAGFEITCWYSKKYWLLKSNYCLFYWQKMC